MNNMKESNILYGPTQKPWKKQIPDGAIVTGPIENPIPVYPSIPPAKLEDDFPDLDYKNFELSPEGLTKRQRLSALAQLETFIKTQHINFTGFQVNEDMNYQDLSWLLDIHTNNVGDPYTSGYLTLNTKLIERAVLDYFAALWNSDWPHHESKKSENDYKKRYWGYVLSMGSTEGNLYGVYNARNYLNGGMLLLDEDVSEDIHNTLKRGKSVSAKRSFSIEPVNKKEKLHQYTPVAFYSEDSHYSVVKAMNVMQVKTFYEVGIESGKPCPINNGKWPKEVPSYDTMKDDIKSGTIKIDDLEKLLMFFLDMGYPPLIILNVGSTWKGAFDDVEEVSNMLKRLGEQYPWLWEREVEYKTENGNAFTETRRGFWLHVDGALGAPYLPFIEMAYNLGHIKHKGPVFDFRNEAVMSICCSMHKWMGGPWPGGIFMTRTEYQLNPPASAGYIGSADTTLGGSRNAFSPILFWIYFAKNSYTNNMEMALSNLKTAKHLEERLKRLEGKLKEKDPTADLWIHRSMLSLAVRFRMVNPTIAYKFTVDGERLIVPLENGKAEERTFAHIFSMNSLHTMDLVNAFMDYVTDICEREGWKAAFPEDSDKTIDGQPNPGKINYPAASHGVMR